MRTSGVPVHAKSMMPQAPIPTGSSNARRQGGGGGSTCGPTQTVLTLEGLAGAGAADDGVRTSADSATRRLAPGLYTWAQITCHRTSKAHNARRRRASPCRVHAATGTYTNKPPVDGDDDDDLYTHTVDPRTSQFLVRSFGLGNTTT
jgi:hypothetical protein